MDQAVADGANVILIAANSADGVNDSLKKAADAGCKIVYVDSAASYDCVTALATDNEKAGQTAGETMLETLKNNGAESGTIGIMGVTKDTASCVAREKGFREAFEGTDFTLADTVYMEDDAQKVADAVTQGMNDAMSVSSAVTREPPSQSEIPSKSLVHRATLSALIHPTMFWLWFQKVSFMQQWNRSHRRWDMTD